MNLSLRSLSALLLLPLLVSTARADDWPQWMGPQRDDVWREKGILDKFPVGGPKVKWRTGVAWGYAGPAVANGKVYVTDLVTDADVRKGNNPGGKPEVKGKERVLCLDATNGKVLWKHEDDVVYKISYPGGPRCTPTVHDGKVYTLGAEGLLLCLDAEKGGVIWSKDFKKDYKAETPFWGHASHPLIDGKKLICVVGGEGSVAVAFDKDTGKELWKSLSAKNLGYCPPTLIKAGGTKQVVIWHGESINGLDPETGKPFWSVELKPAFAMAIATPRQAGDFLFASGYNATVLLKLASDKPEVKEVWRGTAPKNALYAINVTPFIEADTIYGVDQPGQLRGVKLEDGERLWETSDPVSGKKPQGSGTAFLVKNGDRFFLFNEMGELVIAKLSPKGCDEISRAKLLEPTNSAFGRDVVWSHPAFANKCIFARNDKEIICVNLAAE
jgi:outer membrane protein assembly factor BamB